MSTSKNKEQVEVITRYERDAEPKYSVDGGKTWHTKEEFKNKEQEIG